MVQVTINGAKTGRKPAAIVPVALYGMPYRIDEIMEIADRYGIPVVEDAAEGMGSRFDGKVLGTFGKYGVLSFNGNKMITTSGGGALICRSAEDANEIMWYATQYRESYPYYQHEKTAVGGAAGVIHQVDSATTDCQPNENVEALRVFMLGKKIEARPTWKPMHKQPVYAGAPVYTNGIEEELFKVGFCLPAGPYVTDDDVRYIVESIKEAIVG